MLGGAGGTGGSRPKKARLEEAIELAGSAGPPGSPNPEKARAPGHARLGQLNAEFSGGLGCKCNQVAGAN